MLKRPDSLLLPQQAILTNSVLAVMQISQSTSEGTVYAVVAGLTARQKQHCSASDHTAIIIIRQCRRTSCRGRSGDQSAAYDMGNRRRNCHRSNFLLLTLQKRIIIKIVVLFAIVRIHWHGHALDKHARTETEAPACVPLETVP